MKKPKSLANEGLTVAAKPVVDPENDYEAKSALDTMMQAHEHMQNPDMMKRVKKHAGRKLKALTGMGFSPDEPDADDNAPVKNMKELMQVRSSKLQKKPY